MPDFHTLLLEFSKLLVANIIKKYELDYMIKKCISGLMFMYSDAHGLANMLDPRFIAEGMQRQNCEALEDIPFQFHVDDELEDILFRFHVDDELRESVDEVRAQIIFKKYKEFVIDATKAKQE